LLSGAVDDIWAQADGQLFIVDYKSTAKEEEVNLDAEWQVSYKRQMEIYQWLFRKNGFKVSPIGYFVYCNGITEKEAFNAKLEFDIKIIPYEGNDAWVDPKIFQMHECLMSPVIPEPSVECDYCVYHKALKEVNG
jgi:RecB family exonuclease